MKRSVTPSWLQKDGVAAFIYGSAIRASRSVHAHAREITCPVAQAVASGGAWSATAHMADHSLGAALYAQKALKLAGQSYQEEGAWQVEQHHLPEGLAELVELYTTSKSKRTWAAFAS